jgi:hypothetical protein
MSRPRRPWQRSLSARGVIEPTRALPTMSLRAMLSLYDLAVRDDWSSCLSAVGAVHQRAAQRLTAAVVLANAARAAADTRRAC